MYAFCDTDSMAIPSEMTNIIQNYFQKLNPYSFDKPLFKLEDENFINGKEFNLWFYGISSKRYVLYNIVNGKIIIRKPFSKKIKPYNFCLVGFGNDSLKPVCPYRNNPSEVVFDEFIDYNTGEIHCGEKFWKDLKQIFWEYLNHPESKFDGNKGILQRKHIKPNRIIVIGKESNSLEESEILGLDENSYQIFENQSLDIKKIILNLTPKGAKSIGISKNQLYRMKKSIRGGTVNFRKKTIKKIKDWHDMEFYSKK